jgi:alpha,alpha-trehalose phosphorylase
MMPMYLYTNPEIAKKLILYRYNILSKAKERAQQMDDQGALFSWNSINGEECGHVFEAVTAQYHINNDVFYAIYRYYQATNDEGFMVDYCAEILFEISKCMAHRGSFIPNKDNKFCINVICGPDEYNPIVDNNMYTNLLTQKQLYFTLEIVKLLEEKYPEKYHELREKCEVDDNEILLWKRAADNMYIPYSKELDMYMQDDNFIYKDPIDVEKIPLNKLPLLTNLHPLNLWRYQVCKQADIVLLTFICSDYFTFEERKRIFDYYEPKTIHDSSLSASIHSIVACDIGYLDEAYDYLKQASRMDLDNVNRNTFFGLHAACMGATWMMMVNGYAGLRIFDNKLHFKPFIDEKWNFYRFKLRFRDNLLEVKVDQNQTTYKLQKGQSLEIEHCGKNIKIDGEISIPHKER